MQRKFPGAACGALFILLACAASAAEVQELKIPKGAGGIGFLPLLVMEQQKLIEKHAAVLGNKNLKGNADLIDFRLFQSRDMKLFSNFFFVTRNFCR